MKSSKTLNLRTFSQSAGEKLLSTACRDDAQGSRNKLGSNLLYLMDLAANFRMIKDILAGSEKTLRSPPQTKRDKALIRCSIR
jgi:hypothetical protein